jgi:hypothetical protein
MTPPPGAHPRTPRPDAHPARRRAVAHRPARSKSIEKRGPGLGYGFVSAMCFTLAFFVLLCGLVLDGFRETVAAELEAKRERLRARGGGGARAPLGPTSGIHYRC